MKEKKYDVVYYVESVFRNDPYLEDWQKSGNIFLETNWIIIWCDVSLVVHSPSNVKFWLLSPLIHRQLLSKFQIIESEKVLIPFFLPFLDFEKYLSKKILPRRDY